MSQSPYKGAFYSGASHGAKCSQASMDCSRRMGSVMPVTLLSRETHINNNDALLLHPTTYEAKYVQTTPFFNGSLYIQDASEVSQDNGKVDLNKMTLSQLYSSFYLPYLQKKKRRVDLEFSLPPSPPDFDCETPTDPECVMKYVKGLAAAYHNDLSDPSPFQLYEHLIAGLLDTFTSVANASGVENKDNLMNDCHSPILSSPDDSSVVTIHPIRFYSFSPLTEMLSLTVSMWLSNIHEIPNLGIAIQKILDCPSATKAIDSSVVKKALKAYRELILQGENSQEKKNEVCTLMGLVVLPRGEIQEVLEYVDILDLHALNTNSSILPNVIPFYEEMIRSFSLSVPAQYNVSSPVDAAFSEVTKLPLMLPEGTSVISFSVSPCGRLLAVATITGLLITDRDSGKVISQSFDAELAKSCWVLQFSSDSTKLVLTTKTGQRHVVLSSTLEYVSEHNTDFPAIPVNIWEETPRFAYSPKLTSGHKSSLYLVSNGSTLVDELGCAPDKMVESFVVCAHIHSDFVGCLAVIESCDDVFTLHVERSVITLSQGSYNCFGAFPNTAPWHFVYARWSKGTWTLGVDNVLVELRGSRSSQPKTFRIVGVKILDAVGHIGSLVVWAGDNLDGRIIKRFSVERFWDPTVRPLLHLPLDEGEGSWIKDLATMRALSIPEQSFLWDNTVCCPCVPTNEVDHNVRLPHHVFLQSEVLVSDYRILITLPSLHKCGDATVLVVPQDSQRIQCLYHCPGFHSQTLYFIARDESLLFMYQQRFSTFSVAAISTAPRREQKLLESGIVRSDALKGSPGWLSNEILKHICIDGINQLRIPVEINPLRKENLCYLAGILKNARNTSNPLKLVAAMTLALVDFELLSTEDTEKLAQIAKSLNRSCRQIMEWFPDSFVRDVASALFRAGANQCLTLMDKVDILINAHRAGSADVLDSCMNKDSLYSILSFLINEKPLKVLDVAKGLLQRCDMEESGSYSGRQITHLMLWFSIISVQSLHTHGCDEIITSLLELFLEYVKRRLTIGSWDENMKQTVVHSGFLPLIISVSTLCPSVVTPNVENELQALLDAAPKDTDCYAEVPLSFTTRQACDVLPTSDETPWKVILDYTKASSVAISREASSAEVTLITSSPSAVKPTKVVLNNETTFIKFKGSTLIAFSSGEVSLTTVCSYDLHVRVTWVSMVRDAILNLLLAVSKHLTVKPKPCDVSLAPLLRHGLDTKTLASHGLDVPHRVNEQYFAVNILNNVDDGKVFTDEVWKNMKGGVTLGMRPAIQALLSLLIHSGLNPQQAEDELKLRWFSGEWGSKLQGAGKDTARQSLVDLAKWITSSVFCDNSVSPQHGRFTGARTSGESPMASSRSITDQRSSVTSIRRSNVKNLMQNQDTLDQVRALFNKGITPAELEEILVKRTAAALSVVRGLRLLSAILSRSDQKDSATLHGVLEVLWPLCGEGCGQHMIESLVGSGTELEMSVRRAFHFVLERCQALLLSNSPKEMSTRLVLTIPVPNGSSIMLLLAIMCHSWDATDCDFLKSQNDNEIPSILDNLEEQMKIPTYSLTLTSPWRRPRRGKQGVSDTSEDKEVWGELIGAAEYASINCILPNAFSVTIPNLQISASEDGLTVEKTTSGSLLLRADESWTMTSQKMEWFGGVPRVFYYEVTLTSPCYKISVALGQCRMGTDRNQDVSYYYENTGTTHDVCCPSFEDGDTVGCGVVAATRRIFFTLNGVFISFMGTVHDRTESIYPTIRIDNRERASFNVNFGSASFRYDFRQLHPALCLSRGPTWYTVASASEIVLLYITTRACNMQDSRRQNARSFLLECCTMVCRNINKVTSHVMSAGVGNVESVDKHMQQSVILAIAESSITNFVAILRHIMKCFDQTHQLPEALCDMVFTAATVLMLVPIHSIQMTTIRFLPEIIPHIRRVRDTNASASLVKTLFEHAKVPVDTRGKVPYIPRWHHCDYRCVSISHAQSASMQPEAQRSIVLGTLLPRIGKASFVVRVFRRGMSKGHSLKGGYYVGIAAASLTPLAPGSNTQNWKVTKPPVVWALHDISPQLAHATNPTVKPNNFHRSFGSGDAIRVVVNREKQTVSFYRDDEFLKALFTDIPMNIDLVPFVQLYNDDASTFIDSGEMTAPISPATLLGAASVDVLRCMLTLEPFERLVANGICEELDSGAFPAVAMALFKSTPDPRILQLNSTRTGKEIYVTVCRMAQRRVKLSVGNAAYYENAHSLRTAVFPAITGAFVVNENAGTLEGVKRCIASLVTALCRLFLPLITTHALCLMETQQRRDILEGERDQWDHLFHTARVSHFLNIQRSSQTLTLLESIPVPNDYAFSALLSHPGFDFSPRHCGRLGTVPSGAHNTNTPFIAIGEPVVPMNGRFSIRCQLLRGNNGQILGGGYYFGICSSSLDWKRRDLNAGNPEVWAIHDMDDSPWRLRHLHPATRFQIAAEPSCIILSGDIIRLEVDREEGTMHAYRKGVNQGEIHMGLVFDNIPQNVELYPFVHLYNTDAVAVLLPSEGDGYAIRTTVQQPHFATCFTNEKLTCDGCVTQNIETRLSSQLWYKCNECADYNLCKLCFSLCMHSHHSFTKMGPKPLVYSTAPPAHIEAGMSVVIPGTTSLYLKSIGCRMEEKHMNCVAEAKENNAMAMWGLVFQKKAIFTVTVDTLNGEPLSLDRPMFFGVGEVNEISSLSIDALRGRCIANDRSIVAICSDSSMNRNLNSPSHSSCKFHRGSTISIEIDSSSSSAVIKRDWITVGVVPVSFFAQDKVTNLAGFVIFARKNVVASIYPEEGHTIGATVESVSGSCVHVSANGRDRLLTPDHCRILLEPCTQPPGIGTTGYVFMKKNLIQCNVVSLEGDEAVLHFPLEDAVRHFPYTQFFTGNFIAEERLLHREVRETGATVSEGFVMSRLLLILSCLCESETLSPIVLLHQRGMMCILDRLAAVEISNDAPCVFIQEVRTAVAATCNCVRLLSGGGRLSGFMPSLNTSRYMLEPRKNMLVCAIQGVHQGKTFCIMEVENQKHFLGKDLSSSVMVQSVDITDCIPVKQCDGKPWWTLPNGMPCSLLEHTLRVTQPGLGSSNISLEGEWKGEITLPKRGNGSISLQLSTDCTGVATLNLPSRSLECTVFWEHVRYTRGVRICLYNLCDPLQGEQQAVKGIQVTQSFEASLNEVESMIPLGTTSSSFLAIMDGVMDEEGQRVSGSWKPRSDRSGTFTINSFRRVTFIPPSTDLAHIEPLPECKDPLIPTPPQYDAASTLHRLIVLLGRHLYLVLLGKDGVLSGNVIQGIIHYHSHPLTDRLISLYVDMEQLRRTAYETLHLIVDSNTKPWDSTTLSVLITKCVLLRPEVAAQFPSLLWDSFHAVIVATLQCGVEYRHHLLKNVIAFLQKNRYGLKDIYQQLLSSLLIWVDRSVSNFGTSSETRKDIAAGVELVMSVDESLLPTTLCHIPLAPLQCLIDMSQSFQREVQLPKVVDFVGEEITMEHVPRVEAECIFGEFIDGILKVGKVMSSCAAGYHGKYYYEATLPERITAAFVIGWGTEQHTEVPSQHVGSDIFSFAFTGGEISSKSNKEEYKTRSEIGPGSVIGSLLDMDEKVVAWSVNGEYGPFVPIPIDYGDQKLFAFSSTGSCSGMKVALEASQFEYSPDGYTDLSGRHTRVLISTFDEKERSSLPYRPISFYRQLVSYVSDVEEVLPAKTNLHSSSLSVVPSALTEQPDVALLNRYPSIADLTYEERMKFVQVIRVAESCMATARRFIDLDSQVVDDQLSAAFLCIKQIVRRSFGKKLLVNIPPVEKSQNPPSITVRITDLYSNLPRSPEVALQHSVLSQIYKQIGSFTDKQFGQNPLFKVHLYITSTGHVPQDLGGPYRQLWTFLCEELMAHPDKCYPHSDYHRNPLCRYLNNSQRVALVPDSSANSAYDIVLLNFLGKLMGYAARSKNPLSLDFSPFVWKYLVEDALTVTDYYRYVDSVVEKSMEDSDFFLSGMAEEIVPNLADKLMNVNLSEFSREGAVNVYRELAESCLTHSMDLQLNAVREGLWSVLPKRVIRCLSWSELERLVCGESDLTMDQMKQSIDIHLQAPRDQLFWRVIEELTVDQRSSFLCFACGQKRVPLIKRIKVTENTESTDHLPRAQSCSALVTIPPYDTYELFKEKLLMALAHGMEMELA